RQDGQRTAAQQFVHSAGRGVAQPRDFLAGKYVQAAAGKDPGVDGGELGGGGLCGGLVVHGTSIWGEREGGKRNGRVSPAAPVTRCGVDQNSYLKPIRADHCEMPWVKLSESVGIEGSSAKR